MRVVFLGDSHTWPLVKGVRAKSPFIDIKGQPLGSQRHLCEPFFKLIDGTIEITNPDVAKYASTLPLPGYESCPYILSLGFHTAHFAWIAKNIAHLGTVKDERWAISTGAWDTIIEAKQRYQKEFIRALKKLVPSIIVVEAPRLFADSEYCQGRNLDTIRFIDQRARDTFADFLDKESIPVVRLMSEMLDDNGFMRPDYRSPKEGDQHHASPKLGEELAPRIMEILTTRG